MTQLQLNHASIRQYDKLYNELTVTQKNLLSR